MERQYSPATSTLCVDAASTLEPFAMWPAFPTSDYYDSSAPSRRYRLATSLSFHQLRAGGRGDRRDGSHVHLEPLHEVGAQLCPCDFATVTPQAFSVASSAGDI